MINGPSTIPHTLGRRGRNEKKIILSLYPQYTTSSILVSCFYSTTIVCTLCIVQKQKNVKFTPATNKIVRGNINVYSVSCLFGHGNNGGNLPSLYSDIDSTTIGPVMLNNIAPRTSNMHSFHLRPASVKNFDVQKGNANPRNKWNT